MSSFEVLVREIDDIYDHPNADRLSLVKILGYEAITMKNADGSHRFRKGEPVIYVPEASVVPEDVMREYGFWNEEKNIGMLAGKRGDRVKAIRLRGTVSQGLIFPTHPDSRDGASEEFSECFNGLVFARRNGSEIACKVGDDVADFFDITKYEPPIANGMSGEVAGAPEFSFSYDIENAQNFPGFLDDDEVEATEKLHGTNFRVVYHPIARHDEIFGDGSVGVASKGLGERGLLFKNNRINLGPLWTLTDEEIKEDRIAARRWKYLGWLNRFSKWTGFKVAKPRNYSSSNLYVRLAIEYDLIEKVRALGERLGKRVDLFGEIFGVGVQDLHYGTKRAEYRAFDIAIDRRFAGTAEKIALFAELGIERVPVLYQGPWDEAKLIALRDGKTMLGGKNIREGIVVTATGDQTPRLANGHQLRPILKMVSPAYLTRGGDATEYN